MMFELLNHTTATLSSVTPRTEKHGDDDVFAISLGLSITGPNTLLDKLSPALRPTLYKPADDTTDQLPGVEESTPLLRAHGMSQIALKATLQGWTLRVDHGIDEQDPITLGDCKVDNFRVVPHDGGTVDLMFRIGSSDIDAEEAGLLCSKLRQEITFTLTAPAKNEATGTEATGAAIDGTTAAFKKDHPDAPGFDFDAENGGQRQGDDDGTDSEGGATDATPEGALAAAVAGDDGAAEQAELEAGMKAAVAQSRKSKNALDAAGNPFVTGTGAAQ